MRRWLMIMMTLTTLVTLIASCQRRPLYVVEQNGVKVVVKVMWKTEVYPDGVKPSGVSFYFFRDEKFYMQYTTSEVDSCAVQLEPGRYKLYMISQSPEEYGQLVFKDMTDYDRANVSVVETTRAWYKTKEPDETLISNPELMTAGVSEEFEVSEDMVIDYQYYQYELKRLLKSATKGVDDEWRISKAEAAVDYYTIRIPVYPRNIVSQYWVTIYSDNADVLQAVRAGTSGMARTFQLTQDVTGAAEGTQFITQWELTMDDPGRRVGHVDGKITTFGFPRGEMPSPQRDSTLNVATLLIDNETVENYVFNVGDKIILDDPPMGYRKLYRLILGSVSAPAIHPPDVKPQPGSDAGGFTAGVAEWDEEQNVGVEI